jgi:hypothetical protein
MVQPDGREQLILDLFDGSCASAIQPLLAIPATAGVIRDAKFPENGAKFLVPKGGFDKSKSVRFGTETAGG